MHSMLLKRLYQKAWSSPSYGLRMMQLLRPGLNYIGAQLQVLHGQTSSANALYDPEDTDITGSHMLKMHAFCQHRQCSSDVQIVSRPEPQIPDAQPLVLDPQKQKEKDSERLGRWKVDHLNRLLDLLDLPRGSGQEGTKVHPLMSHHFHHILKSKQLLLPSHRLVSPARKVFGRPML